MPILKLAIRKAGWPVALNGLKIARCRAHRTPRKRFTPSVRGFCYPSTGAAGVLRIFW
jgi:hypothetical protein